MKKALMIIGGLVVLCGGGFMLLSAMGLWGVAQVAEESNKQSTAEAAAPGGSYDTAVDIGTPVTVGDLSYTVTEASTEAADQGKLIVVHYTVSNGGTEAKSVWSLDLVDGQGRKFQETTIFGSPHVPDGQECIFTTMNPGMSETCTKLFEVPADAAGLAFHVSGILDGDAFVKTGQ